MFVHHSKVPNIMETFVNNLVDTLIHTFWFHISIFKKKKKQNSPIALNNVSLKNNKNVLEIIHHNHQRSFHLP